VSAVGYAVPPIPEGAELEALIGRRWQMLLMHERELPKNAPRRGTAAAAGYEAPILQTSPCPRIILGRYSNTPIPDRYSDSLCFKISDSVLSICRYILTHFSV
jgi:hypothetical protein